MSERTDTGAHTVRRRISDARAKVVGTSGLRAKAARQATAISTLKSRLDEQQQRVVRQEQRLKELEARVTDLGRYDALDTSERERRDAQFGVLEVRLADLEEQLAQSRQRVDAADTDLAQLAEGRTLLEEVRAEHARIRVRMQVVSAYEERLRRVEESVAELFEGDPRHLV